MEKYMSTKRLIFYLATIVFVWSFTLFGQDDEVSNAPLVRAINRRDTEEAHRLIKSGTELNRVDNLGTTPLLQAINRKLSHVALELVEAGADVNFTGLAKQTPLMVAAWYGDLEAASALIARGARVNDQDSVGETALIFAAQTSTDAKMVRFLLDAKADVNMRTRRGNTALMAAADEGNVAAVKELLQSGAQSNISNEKNQTAENLACERGLARNSGHDTICQILKTTK